RRCSRRWRTTLRFGWCCCAERPRRSMLLVRVSRCRNEQRAARVHAMIARLVVWALRARWGLAAVVITCNLSGLAVIVTQLWPGGFFDRLGPDILRALAIVAIYPAIGFGVGIVLAIRDRTVYFAWLDQTRKP